MKIGFLNAYHFEPDSTGYQAQYAPMMRDYWAKIAPDHQIQTYELPKNQWPGSLSECDGWVIGGSPKSAYETDEWILKLKEWIQSAHQNQSKLIGICFGHQIIADALGGEVQKSNKGWGVGVCSFEVKKQTAWMSEQSPVNLLFSHQDQVTTLPKEAELIAENDFCPIQMYRIGNHIFSIQGHPEFTPKFMASRLEARREIIGESVVQTALQTLTQPTDHLEIGKWISSFLK